MREREQGRVMPFGMPGVRLRRSAQEYRRRGQVLEALSLVRRAAAQDDTAAGWQALAAELRQLSCWEAASVVLGRIMSRPEMPSTVWLDMARCMSALGNRAVAEDCLYHLLHEQPWSPEGDAARDMLQDMEETEAEAPGRLKLLTQRALHAWSRGEGQLGLRRMRRAIRMTRKKARLLNTLGLMYTMEGNTSASLGCIARAMKEAPGDPLAACSMAAMLHQLGRRRMARGFLSRAAALCTEPVMEERFCTTAWMMEAWPQLEAYLEARLRRTPYRVPLLRTKADYLHVRERCEQAQEVWRLILSIDPDDRRAATMLEWTKVFPDSPVQPGTLPAPETECQRAVLRRSEELFTWGSEARRALDWCIASADPKEQTLAMETAARHPDREAEIRWLRELLTRPELQEPLRHKALMRLAELQHFEPVTVLLGGRYVTAQCQPVKTSPGRRLWRMFLPVLLRTAGAYDDCSGIVAFAAEMWGLMTPAEKQEAATVQAVSWSRLFVVLWLWQMGRNAEADQLINALHMPVRRFRRLLNRFLMTLENDPGDAGEGDT